MQKETVRSSKLRKLRNFDIRIGNLRKNPVKFCRQRKDHGLWTLNSKIQKLIKAEEA